MEQLLRCLQQIPEVAELALRVEEELKTWQEWFGGGEPDDALGALPYDAYIVEEQPCEANADRELIPAFEVSVYRDGATIDLGTLVNSDKPHVSISKADIVTGDISGRGRRKHQKRIDDEDPHPLDGNRHQNGHHNNKELFRKAYRNALAGRQIRVQAREQPFVEYQHPQNNHKKQNYSQKCDFTAADR